MTAKVAPYFSVMSAPDAPAGDSPSKEYATFLDAVLDQVCCAADDPGRDSTRRASAPAGTARGRRHPPHPHQNPLPSQWVALSRSTSCLSRMNSQKPADDGGAPNSLRAARRGSVILPHLRFNPLPSATCSTIAPECSSLQDFFALFLVDDAPHSFQLFHERNGDENVSVTSWSGVASIDGYHDVIESNRMERTIAFRTKISPGSSSNPLSQLDESNRNTNVILLNVTVAQTLVQLAPKKWILKCEFSFDFQSQSKLSAGGLGAGLSQFLMSNVIKGSIVNVAVTLSECNDGAIDARVNVPPPKIDQQRTGIGDAHVTSVREPRCSLPPCQDDDEGLMSCLSHPLLMPPDGLCGAPDNRVNNENGSPQKGIPLATSFEEPAELGASLLSAIKKKNALCESYDNGPISDASLAGYPYPNSRLAGLGSILMNSNSRHGQQRESQRGHEDVLTCSSAGTPKAKRIPPFEMLSRAPSEEAMRRMIVQQDGMAAVSPSAGNGRQRSSPNSIADTDVLLPLSQLAAPRGLSMHIDMELCSLSSSNINTKSSDSLSPASSLSSSFSRSASITAMDEKVRRGLKKRVARSWIMWAERWCMRLWEEEGQEILSSGRRSVALGGMCGLVGGRERSNVRPSVRRIGEARREKPVWRSLTSEENSRRAERWMSLEGDGEVGVEVACASALSRVPAIIASVGWEGPSPGGAPNVEDLLGQTQGGTKVKKSKRRLLKGLSGGFS